MPRNLALNISVGAILDSSIGRTFNAVTKSSDELGKKHRELNRELGQVRAVKRYADRLGALQREAAEAGKVSNTLARRIKNAENRFTAASENARRYGLNISDVGRAEARLNRQIERNNRSMRMRERLGSAKKSAGAAGQGLLTGGIIGGTVFGAGLAAITATNKMAAEQANLAASVGLSQKQLSVWSGIVSQLGYDASKVADLVEELNNKFGESKGLYEQTTAVSESMQILRLDFEKLKRLKPDEQFKQILEAAQKIGGQEAASAADILMGNKSNTIIGYLNSLNDPVDELFNRFEKLYVGSTAGLEGAKTFNSAWGELIFTLGNAFQELTGVVGSQLAPQMREWAVSMADAFRSNKEKIGEFAQTIGSTLAHLGEGLVSLATELPTIVKAMSKISGFVMRWFGDDEEESSAMNSPARASATSSAMALAMKRQSNTTYGRYAHDPKEIARGSSSVSQDNRINVAINIQQQPGESGVRVAERVRDKIKTLQARPDPVPLYADPGALG